MATISLCMIVKNEEPRLRTCLDSLKGLMDEMIIVDTGSTDRTKQIALEYTDKVYDFTWTGNFSDARNYAFSLASMEYIYSADADEELDAENRERFRLLKESLVPEVEIVQMYYANQLEHGTVYNFDRELRPKLFRRMREFVWIEPIHETVRLEPVVFDSEIEIIHRPGGSHAERDLEHFERLTEDGGCLSDRLFDFYARELYLCGDAQHLDRGIDFFARTCEEEGADRDKMLRCCSILVRTGRVWHLPMLMLKYGLRATALESCSEVCCEMGMYFEEIGDLSEAVMWYFNAYRECSPVLQKDAGDVIPLKGLIRCYEKLQDVETALTYKKRLEELGR